MLSPVYEGFYSAVAIDGVGDNLYVVDQIGILYQCREDTIKPVLDIQDRVGKLKSKYDERGFLGFALSPHEEDLAYIFYCEKDRNVVARADLETKKIEPLLYIEQKVNHHNSGNLLFGPDGMLYITVGDGSDQKDPQNHGQSLNTLHGKVLRIDVDQKEGYSIPEDNPFLGGKALPEIYAYGLRNPWGTAFTGDRLFLADVGFESFEEVNIIQSGGNYGWNLYEGSKKTPWNKARGKNIIQPIYEYSHKECGTRAKEKGMCCIIGGAYVENSFYVFGELAGALRILDNTWTLSRERNLSNQDYLKAIGKDQNNLLYAMTSPTLGPKANSSKVSLIHINKI